MRSGRAPSSVWRRSGCSIFIEFFFIWVEEIENVTDVPHAFTLSVIFHTYDMKIFFINLCSRPPYSERTDIIINMLGAKKTHFFTYSLIIIYYHNCYSVECTYLRNVWTIVQSSGSSNCALSVNWSASFTHSYMSLFVLLGLEKWTLY